jgi:hypothetical protein
MHFSAPLGARHAALFRFKFFDGKPGANSTFKCAVDKPLAFSVAPTLSVPGPPAGADAWDGAAASVEVVFEGTSMSAVPVAGVLTVTSDATGSTWTVPLSAVCLPPRPAGPFTLAQGAPTVVDFRNVFNDDREFVVSTDQPSVFAVAPAGTLKLAKKTSQALSVTYSAPADGSSPRGKLVVSCPSVEGAPSWTYYLHGAAVEGGGAPAASRPPTRGGSAKPKK